MSRKHILWIFLLPALLGQVKAICQPSARASLDSTDILIGDEVQLRMEISLPAGARLLRIGTDTLRMVKGLERRRASGVDSLQASNTAYYSQSFVLSAFDSGYYRLPPIPVDIQTPQGAQRLYSNDLSLMVRSIPISVDTAQIQPIKGIWKEPLQLTDIWWVLLLVLSVLALIWIWRRLRRKSVPEEAKEAASAPQRPAHELAIEQLQMLKTAGLLEKGHFKEYQSELTYILKAYLSNRYQVHALESTTDEVEVLLKDVGVETSASAMVVALLQRADFVKFAKGSLSVAEHETAWQTACDFVLATQEQKIIATLQEEQ